MTEDRLKPLPDYRFLIYSEVLKKGDMIFNWIDNSYELIPKFYYNKKKTAEIIVCRKRKIKIKDL